MAPAMYHKTPNVVGNLDEREKVKAMEVLVVTSYTDPKTWNPRKDSYRVVKEETRWNDPQHRRKDIHN